MSKPRKFEYEGHTVELAGPVNKVLVYIDGALLTQGRRAPYHLSLLDARLAAIRDLSRRQRPAAGPTETGWRDGRT